MAEPKLDIATVLAIITFVITTNATIVQLSFWRFKLQLLEELEKKYVTKLICDVQAKSTAANLINIEKRLEDHVDNR